MGLLQLPPTQHFSASFADKVGARALIACITLISFVIAGCGAGQSDAALGRPVADVATPARYASALRLAALARVEARGGNDEVAAEHFRAAYRQHADVSFLLAYARSAERAKLYAESHDALRRAQLHALSPEERAQLAGEINRLQPLVPPGLVRVSVQVSPENARVELSRPAVAGQTGRGDRAAERVMLGSGWLYLPPGTWTLYSTAKGYQSELRSLQVAPESTELIGVALATEDAAPQLVDTTKPREDKRVEDKPIAQKPVEEGPVVQFGAEPVKPGRSPLHKWGPIATTALGVLAVGAGGWLGWQAKQNATSANDLLGQGLSPVDYTNQFETYHTNVLNNAQFANYAFIGGGALLAAGTLWWLLAPSPKAVAAGVQAPDQTTDSAHAAHAGRAPQSGTMLGLPQVHIAGSGVALHWGF